MIDLDTVKNYLRIDYDDDDRLLNMLILGAETYLQEGITDYILKYENNPRFHRLADTLILSLISEQYNNRDQMKGDVGGSWGMNYLMRSMMTQMEYCPIREDEDDADSMECRRL